VGIRPEDLCLSSQAKASMQGEVEIVEDLGCDRFVHFTCGSVELVARMTARAPVNRGEIVHFAAEASRLHLFYQGKRIQ